MWWKWALGGAVVLLVMRKKVNNSGSDYASLVNTGGGRPLTHQAVYNLARDAGFPAEVARRMVAIAVRESGLIPTARCKNCAGVPEDSIGLWQINMLGDLGTRRLALFGISSPEDLLDPAVNAMAAFRTWNGQERNLNIAWHIHEDGLFPYRTRYLAALNALPAMERMELAYSGIGGGVLA